MTKVRPLNKDKYEISKHRFLELYHFCLQYQEWKNELNHMQDTVKSTGYGTTTAGSGGDSATERLVIRREKLRKNCERIEQTAIETDPDIYEYILIGVTTEYGSYRYLSSIGMPCGKTMYYERRRRFYWLLSKKI